MQNKSDKSIKGIVSLLLTGFCFSFYGVFARYVAKDFGTFYQTTSRYTIGMFIFLALTLMLHAWKTIRKNDTKWFLLQGFFGAGVNIPYYLAVTHLPIGIALFLFYASSVLFSFLFGSLFLQEKLDKVKIIALLLSIVGIFLIYQGDAHNFSSIWTFMGIFAGMFFGFYSASSKMLNLKYSEVQINLVSYIVTLLLTAPFVLVFREHIFLNFTALSWKVNILYSIVGVITSFTLIYGFKYIEAQKGSLILLSELAFVVINGFLFFGENPTVVALIGGICIFAALALPNIYLKEKV